MRSLALALALLVVSAAPAAAADTTPPVPAIVPPSTLAAAAIVTFPEAVRGVSTSNVVIRVSWTAADLAATVACRSSSGGAVACSGGAVRKVILKPSAPLVAGQRYGVVVNPPGAAPIADGSGNAAVRTTKSFRAPSDQQEWSAGAVYRWRSTPDSRALGGSYVTERSAGAKVTYRFSGSSVAWYTMTGPDQGIADVSIDGVRKGSANLYASSRHFGVRRSYGGLAARAHTITVTARGAKGSAAGTDVLVTVDAFEVSGSTDRSPSLVAAWRRASATQAFGDGYAESDLVGSRVTLAFKGPGIDYYTVNGPNRGRASVYLDGAYKTTIDDYAAATGYGARRSLYGLADTVHTLELRVLGTRSALSTGTRVGIDRWVVRWPSIGALKRLGAWVDLYDYSLDPAAAIADMDARGVGTLFIQTSRYSRPTDVEDSAYLEQWVEAAHAAGMRIVGWYLPGYADLDRDVRRTVAIARFRTSSGQSFDGIGVDIEYKAEVDYDLGRFNAGIVTHLRRVRASVGLVAVGAIVPSPVAMAIRPESWTGFPWGGIARYSDAVMPMAYWSYRHDCDTDPSHCAYGYTTGNIAESRRLTAGLPVHDIGGVGDSVTAAEVADFVRGARDGSAYGGSLYDYRTTQASFWPELTELNRL